MVVPRADEESRELSPPFSEEHGIEVANTSVFVLSYRVAATKAFSPRAVEYRLPVSNTDRPYDIVVWGATGVAGQLVAEHLTETYDPETLSLAIGGRDERRLEALASECCTRTDAWTDLEVVIGDATDPASLRAIARQTDVVCTTVGPYTRYGTPLVEACLDCEADYCDLTGEITWVRELIDRYHEDAREAGVRLVHSCGFDSVPADLGTLLVQSAAIETFETPCDLVRVYLEDGEGGVSGGTMESMATMFEEATTDPLARQTLRNPYSLAPPGERNGVDLGAQRLPKRDSLSGGWTAPSPMAAVNERVIRRSNALLDYPWGREFRCTEVVPTGNGPVGMATAATVAGGLGAATASMSIGPVRSLLREFVFPEPGDGPSRAQIENGHFTVRVRGRGTATNGPFTAECVFVADRDPGYGATARMLGEAALCLTRDEVESPLPGGILTPASGIGTPLADRLRDIGFQIEVETQRAAVR